MFGDSRAGAARLPAADGQRLASVEAAVRAAAVQVEPDPAFQARLRARLLALADDSGQGGSAPRLTVLPGGLPAGRPRRWPRAAPYAAAAVALLVGLGAGSVGGWAGRPPAGPPGPRAEAPAPAAAGHLDAARRRALQVRSAARDGRVEAGRLRPVLDDMDTQTRAGVAMVAATALASARGEPPLSRLPAWVGQQQALLAAAAGGLPTLRTRLGLSAALLARAQTRVVAVRTAVMCSCLPLVGADDLGPVPGRPATAAAPSAPAVPTGTVTAAQTPARAGRRRPAAGLTLPLPSLPQAPLPLGLPPG